MGRGIKSFLSFLKTLAFWSDLDFCAVCQFQWMNLSGLG